MFAATSQSEVSRRIAELRFCLSELQRRQTTDQLRAWLWRLKENAARQALAMLLRLRGVDSSVILSQSDRADLIAHHSLLRDPRPVTHSMIQSHWKKQLRSRVDRIPFDDANHNVE